MTTCGVPGCPCLYNWRECCLEGLVAEDDMDVSNVLRRRGEDGAPGAGLSWHDRYRVFLRLNERGYSARQIARVLGCADRTVFRWRLAFRQSKELTS